MDLTPFLRINPCGYSGMEMVQVKDVNGPDSIAIVESALIQKITHQLDYNQVDITTESR